MNKQYVTVRTVEGEVMGFHLETTADFDAICAYIKAAVPNAKTILIEVPKE